MKKILIIFAFLQIFSVEILSQQMSFPYIKEVLVSGNKSSSKYVVINNLNLKKGDVFNPSYISNGIKYLYKTNMYSDIKVFVSEAGYDSVVVKVKVLENPRIDSIKVVGNDVLSNNDILDTISVKPGQFFNEFEAKKAENVIKEMYKNKGYSFIDVTDDINMYSDSTKANFTLVVKEGKKVTVKEILFEGNLKVNDNALKGLMVTREDTWWRFWGIDYKKDSLSTDLKKIENYYRRLGYLDASVDDYSINFDKEKKATIVIKINEGRRYYFGRVKFLNNSIYDTTFLKRTVGFNEGSPFDVEVYDKSVHMLTSLYSEKGYLYSNITPRKIYQDSLINIEYSIKEGNPAYVHRVVIKGNSKTRDYVIRREITVKPGDIYQQSKIFRSQTRVAQLNFFNNVIPNVVPYDSNSVDIVFTVEEKETGQVSAGLQYAATGLAGTLGLSIPNIAGTGKFASANIEYGAKNKKYSLSFTEPWLLDLKRKTALGGNLSWQYTRQELSYDVSYDQLIRGGSIFSSRRLEWPDDYFSVSLRYSLNRVDVYNKVDADTMRPDIIESENLESKLKFSISRNTTDWPQFPTRGSYLYYSPELAGRFLGGDRNFLKQTIISNVFYPSFWKFVFEFKSKFAILTELPGNNAKSNIGQEKYSIGGNSFDGIFRGYSTNSVGPGNVMYLLRMNYRFPIVDKMLYSAIFSDFGNVWYRMEDMRWTSLKKSVGFGFRAALPGLGVLGVDFGWGLNKTDTNKNYIIDRSDDISGYHWEIMINQEF